MTGDAVIEAVLINETTLRSAKFPPFSPPEQPRGYRTLKGIPGGISKKNPAGFLERIPEVISKRTSKGIHGGTSVEICLRAFAEITV